VFFPWPALSWGALSIAVAKVEIVRVSRFHDLKLGIFEGLEDFERTSLACGYVEELKKRYSAS
jgi:hypothetical protein